MASFFYVIFIRVIVTVDSVAEASILTLLPELFMNFKSSEP